jgi:hypothetical protein
MTPHRTHPFVFCDSQTAMRLAFTGERIAVWLHVERSSGFDLKPLVLALVRAGAVHFAVSGDQAAARHDQIDDCLLDANEVGIPTTWHEEALAEIAWDFANVDFASGGITLRWIIVIGESPERELSVIGELAGRLAAALDPA